MKTKKRKREEPTINSNDQKLKLISENKYNATAKKRLRQNTYDPCKCPPGMCGEDCPCSGVRFECHPHRCSCRSDCANMRIQNNKCVPVLQFLTKNTGWGIKANIFIKKGTFVFSYVGELVKETTYKTRLRTIYKDHDQYYAMHLDKGYVIDAHKMGNDSRFVNHSCEPNCEAQKWTVNGFPCIGIFAAKDIDRGEEITYDYNFKSYSQPQECSCGAKNCRGRIGIKVQPLNKKNVIFRRMFICVV